MSYIALLRFVRAAMRDVTHGVLSSPLKGEEFRTSRAGHGIPRIRTYIE
jgi:hypothetical protein